jgi:hypothetical protein
VQPGELVRQPRQTRPLALGVVAIAAAIVMAGCATYSERMATGREQAAQGAYPDALDTLNDALGVSDASQLPSRFHSDTALILLDRGMVSQAMQSYADAGRDLGAADEALEYIDLSKDPVGAVGKYIYSDSAGKYKSPPTEKLAINSVNIMNYLANRDLDGAGVEARRFTVMRDYLNENSSLKSYGAAGSYLAGFVFERLRDANAAMRYYDEALNERSLGSLGPTIRRLSALTDYRGKRIESYLVDAPPARPDPGKMPTELVVVVNTGRVPYKIPERMLIGAAIGLAGTYISGDPDVLGYTATKVLVYPELKQSYEAFSRAELQIDGQFTQLDLVTNFGAEMTAEYEQMKPKIIGAGISRMIVRAAAAEGAREAGKQAGSAGAVLGWVAALATEATLVALDKPDTRSWMLLPQKVYIGRRTVAPGKHSIEVQLSGNQSGSRTVEIEIPEGGFAVVVITTLR